MAKRVNSKAFCIIPLLRPSYKSSSYVLLYHLIENLETFMSRGIEKLVFT